jgi:hypothetical protein
LVLFYFFFLAAVFFFAAGFFFAAVFLHLHLHAQAIVILLGFVETIRAVYSLCLKDQLRTFGKLQHDLLIRKIARTVRTSASFRKRNERHAFGKRVHDAGNAGLFCLPHCGILLRPFCLP